MADVVASATAGRARRGGSAGGLVARGSGLRLVRRSVSSAPGLCAGVGSAPAAARSVDSRSAGSALCASRLRGTRPPSSIVENRAVRRFMPGASLPGWRRGKRGRSIGLDFSWRSPRNGWGVRAIGGRSAFASRIPRDGAGNLSEEGIRLKSNAGCGGCSRWGTSPSLRVPSSGRGVCGERNRRREHTTPDACLYNRWRRRVATAWRGPGPNPALSRISGAAMQQWSWVVLVVGMGPGPGAISPAVSTPAVTIRLVRPDQQCERLIGLFQGPGRPTRRRRSASWRRTASGREGLGKAAEAAIALLNPAMEREYRTLRDAEIGLGFGPAEGRSAGACACRAMTGRSRPWRRPWP